MIDMVVVQIPLSRNIVTVLKSGEEAFTDFKKLNLLGLKVQARDCSFSLDGSSEPSDLSHPYESLPSSFSTMACKVHKASHLRPWPYLEIKASPAKLLQGHNLFGTTDYRLAINELMSTLIVSLPMLCDNLDMHLAEVSGFDNTFSFRHGGSIDEGRQFISHIKQVSNRYLKASSKVDDYETTAYFDEKSRLMRAKVYLKYFEFKKIKKSFLQRKEHHNSEYFNTLLPIITDPRLTEFSENLIRFEATITKRKLKLLGVPTLITQFLKYYDNYEKTHGKGSLCRHYWELEFNDLIKALKGKNMKILTDNEVHNKLKVKFQNVTPKGNITYSKANRVFGFYRRLTGEGWSNVYSSMSKNTFGRLKFDLLEIGFSIAQLQNLHCDQSNVVSLIKYIEIDFAHQTPDWYEEPTSQARKHFNNVENLRRIA